ncbi:MAG TPA: hypothetical protein VGR57_08005 [Ktedonobacterales bacterium]|nr:hypothetical protein [Ktedonobacterales bacterium]
MATSHPNAPAASGAAATTRPRVPPWARLTWWLLVTVELVSFAASVPALFALLRVPCADPTGAGCDALQAPPADLLEMRRQGLVGVFALSTTTVAVSVSLVFFVVGGVIAWRRWDDPMGVFVSALYCTIGATGFLEAFSIPAGAPVATLIPIHAQIGIALALLKYPALSIFLLTFPNGRFAPRWSWLLIGVTLAQVGANALGAPGGLLFATSLAVWGSAASVQIYRYRRIYTSLERQQTKWVVFSVLLVSLPIRVLGQVAPAVWPALTAPGLLAQLGGTVLVALFWLPLSLGVGIAILRARLYDIDILINRALVYGSLTSILALLYAGGVGGGQRALGGLLPASGQEQSPIVIVGTTLLVVALFQPLRVWLQAVIDRRFFRRKYDAQRTLEAFGATLRDDIDLEALRAEVVAVVQRTMQPAHVSLWLRDSAGERRQGTGR